MCDLRDLWSELFSFHMEVGQHLGNVGCRQFADKIRAHVSGGLAVMWSHKFGIRCQVDDYSRSGLIRRKKHNALSGYKWPVQGLQHGAGVAIPDFTGNDDLVTRI